MERKFRQPPYLEATMHYCSEPSEAGGRGTHIPQCLTDQLALSQPGGGQTMPPTYYLPPLPDFQTFQNPCCSVLVAFLAPSYPFLLKVIGNKRFHIVRLLNKPNELMYFARNPPWHVFWQVSSSAPKNICY